MDAATLFPDPYTLERENGASALVVLCEHASAAMPDRYQDLGLRAVDRLKHIAWDIGALGVARGLSAMFDAALLAGNYTRLLVDCNRFPDAEDAFIRTSEGIAIPGNQDLSSAERRLRLQGLHQPFHTAAAALMDARAAPILVSMHSFTPVYNGHVREVELGLLADQDESIAWAMMRRAHEFTPWVTRVNQPYDANSGVSYSARTHALARGVPHILLEVRQDLIVERAAQERTARMLGGLLRAALTDLGRAV